MLFRSIILYSECMGIYRPVELIVTEPVNIAVTDYASPGIYISQKNVNRKSADVNIKIKLENKKAQAKNRSFHYDL